MCTSTKTAYSAGDYRNRHEDLGCLVTRRFAKLYTNTMVPTNIFNGNIFVSRVSYVMIVFLMVIFGE